MRGETEAGLGEEEAADTESVVPAERLTEAESAIRSVFEGTGAENSSREAVDALPSSLEAALGFGRAAWPLAAIRALADALLAVSAGRRRSPRHEARWLNLAGFCLRPGFGAPLDDWRISQARGLYVEGLAFPNDLQCQVEWIVMWQRVAGGLTSGQQRELYERYSAVLDVRARKPKRINAQVQREAWRLLASLERLPSRERARLGDVLLDRLAKDAANPASLWAIGRFGAREPAYGAVTAVVPREKAEAWIDRLLGVKALTADRAGAIAQIGARINDPLRDIGEETRRRAIDRLAGEGFGDEAEPLRTFVPHGAWDALRVFGESLPEGLKLRE